MTEAPADPRRAAWRVLRDVDAGEHADRSAGRRFADLSDRDRPLALALAFGAVRLRARLDHELDHFVDRPLDRVEGAVLDWLRLGLYQLRELRVPDHAAVAETVEGVRATVGRRAVGFANGVLRSAARHRGDRAALFPDPEEDPLAHLATWGSHPRWLLRRWLDRWPLETVTRLVELDNRPPPVVVRLLEDRPDEAAAGPGEDGFRLDPLPAWPRSAVLAEGEPAAFLRRVPAAVVQDPAASAVVDYLGPAGAGLVLDACAAPGGKAVSLAHMWPRARPFVAADLRRERLELVSEAAGRTGVALACVVMDGRRPAVARAATVLLDVPCTGTGTLRRRPDARWRLGPDRLEDAVRLQRELLEACAEVVEPSGLLVYATCTLEPEENERQVEAFLGRHPDFEREPPGPDAVVPAEAVDGKGDLRVLPWRHGTDGSYAARLRRSAP